MADAMLSMDGERFVLRENLANCFCSVLDGPSLHNSHVRENPYQDYFAMPATYNSDEMKPNSTIHMCEIRMREKVAPTRISER